MTTYGDQLRGLYGSGGSQIAHRACEVLLAKVSAKYSDPKLLEAWMLKGVSFMAHIGGWGYQKGSNLPCIGKERRVELPLVPTGIIQQ